MTRTASPGEAAPRSTTSLAKIHGCPDSTRDAAFRLTRTAGRDAMHSFKHSGCSATFRDYFQAIPRPKRNHRLRHYVGIRRQTEAPLLSEYGKQQHALHPRKAFTDAEARTGSKWEVGKPWTLVLGLHPAFGQEAFRLAEIAAVPVRHPLTRETQRVRRYLVFAELDRHL